MLAACATPSSRITYDPNATEELALVESKLVAARKAQIAGDSLVNESTKSTAIPGGPIQYLIFEAMTKRTEVDVFQYTVRTKTGERIVVYSEYLGFEPGSCVKLFRSSQPSYPRLTTWSGCDF
jgi:hypothetical protein